MVSSSKESLTIDHGSREIGMSGAWAGEVANAGGVDQERQQSVLVLGSVVL